MVDNALTNLPICMNTKHILAGRDKLSRRFINLYKYIITCTSKVNVGGGFMTEIYLLIYFYYQYLWDIYL